MIESEERGGPEPQDYDLQGWEHRSSAHEGRPAHEGQSWAQDAAAKPRRASAGSPTAGAPWRVLPGGEAPERELRLDEAPPPPRVWAGIEDALRAEGLIRE